MWFVLILAVVQTASAFGPTVRLKPSASLGPKLGAFPRLVAAPGDKAAVRINQALDLRDQQLRTAFKECKANVQAPDQAEYTRTVTVTMQGPRYISFVTADYSDCGGAHPNVDSLVLVYDLQTGSPVNWAALLPASMIQGTSLDMTGDGTQIGVISSKALQKLYLQARDLSDSDECKAVLSDPEIKLSLWPDAKGGGIAVAPAGLPHAVVACADAVTIPTAALRKLGVKAVLLDAIDAAR
jgi:hypothetical protein